MASYSDVSVLLSGAGFGREKTFDDRRFAGVSWSGSGAARIAAAARRTAMSNLVTHFTPLPARAPVASAEDQIIAEAASEFLRSGNRRARIERIISSAESALSKIDARITVASSAAWRGAPGQAAPGRGAQSTAKTRLEESLSRFQDISEEMAAEIVSKYTVKPHIYTMSPVYLAAIFAWLSINGRYEKLGTPDGEGILDEFTVENAMPFAERAAAIGDNEKPASSKDVFVLYAYLIWILYDASGFFATDNIEEDAEEDEAPVPSDVEEDLQD